MTARAARMPNALGRGRALQRSATALATYALLSLLHTWPLARHLTTHMPGDGGDDPALAWNLWWIKHQLIDQLDLDIFHVDYMFYPIEINLAFYTLTPLNGLLSVPLQTGFDLLLANNLILLSSFVIGGFGAYLLATYLLARFPIAPHTSIYWPALAAGIFYAFASSKLFYPALGQFNIASSQWIPFCALYLLRTMHATRRRTRLRAATLAGVFLVLQAWAELTYASFLIIFAGLVYLWWLVSTVRDRQGVWGWLVSGLIFGGVFALGIAPFLAAMIPNLLAEGDFFGMGGGFADTFSADLMGYLFPTMLHPWWGEWAAQLPFPNDKGQQIYVGYTLAALLVAACMGIWRARVHTPRLARMGLFWLVAALLFFLLTLGPQLRWAGVDLPITGPFAWVSRLPFFSGNRYPSRYSVMLMLAVSALAAWGLAWLTANFLGRKRATAFLTAGVILLFSVEHLSLPMPLTDARIPPIYTTLANIPGDFAVLELPTGWRNGARIVGRADELIMLQQWYQTAHAKRRLGGNTSRNPQYKFQYFTDAPLLGDLIALMNADRDHLAAALDTGTSSSLDALIAAHRPHAGQVLHDLGIRYVLLHTEPQRSPPALQRFVDEALPLTLVESWEGTDWTGAAAGIRLYAVDPPAHIPTERAIDLRTPAGNRYLAEGWNAHYIGAIPARLAERPVVDMLLPALPPTRTGRALQPTYRLALDPRLGEVPQLTLRWENKWDVDWTLSDGALTFRPPAQATLGSTMARLTLDFDGDARVPSAGTPTAQPIGTTGFTMEADVSLLVRSAGEEVGDFAAIYVDGHNIARNAVGYNLAALTTEGEVLDSAVFNTHADPNANAALAQWLAGWPPGTVIAGAVADEAAWQLDATAVAALANVGSAVDLRDQFRASHAFIGVVGAPAGTAHEAVTTLSPAAVGLGWPRETPAVFGGVQVFSVHYAE